MSNSANINQLFKTARQEGTISPAAFKVLDIPDIGAAIQAGLGVTVDDVLASEVFLVTQLVDDSGSIRFGNNAQIVRDGHNAVIEALRASKQGSSILAHTRYLNGQVLYPYSSLANAAVMNTSNYNPMGGTPLYDEAVVILGTVLAKAQEFSGNGVPVRTATLIMTDGNDEGSFRFRPGDVAAVVADMLRTENHIVAGMGIDDGTTDFRAVFRSMGIRDEWILTPGNTQSEIRKAFNVFSQSAVRASQGAATFTQIAAGGFGQP